MQSKYFLKRTEVVTRRFSVKNVFLEILQHSQENTCARVTASEHNNFFQSNAAKDNNPVVLSATADGTMLPAMLIFKGKTDKTIKKLRIPKGFIVKTQEKLRMDEGLMEVWVEEIWLKYVREVSEQLGFDNSLLKFDAFSAHKTDDVQSKLVENKSDILMIPPGCMSKCQPMDVCINKPFKTILRKIEQMPATTPNDFQLPPPSRQDMVDWVEEAYKLISSDKDTVMHSFDVCGVTTSDPVKVRSGSFCEKCMCNAKSIIEANGLEDGYPFEL